AKWHARTVVVVVTFAFLATVMLSGFHLLLEDDLSFSGCLAAVVTISALLAAVVAMGVAVGGMTNSTVVGITVLWIVLYGAGILTSSVRPRFPPGERSVGGRPNPPGGAYTLTRLPGWVWGGLVAWVVGAFVGLRGFARRDF